MPQKILQIEEIFERPSKYFDFKVAFVVKPNFSKTGETLHSNQFPLSDKIKSRR